jgi:protein-disulfide isomerase
MSRKAQLAAVVAAAAVIVVAAVLIAGGSSDKKPPKKRAGEVIPGQTAARSLFAGIPEHGVTLGNPNAKVTMLEFADLQCPACREYTLTVFPDVVKNYVRTGKVKVRFIPLTVISKDSNVAWSYAAGAAQQNKLWNFADLTYINQGQEGTHWVTPLRMRQIARGVTGLDFSRMAAYAATPAAREALGAANTQAGIYGLSSTPSLLVSFGNAYKKLPSFDYQTVSSALDAAASE